jgi:predicted peptidase
MNQVPRVILFYCLMVFFMNGQCQSSWKETMDKDNYTTTKGSLPYRIFIPDSVGADEKIPLVLFLHGAGERGDDNESQLLHGVKHFLTDSIQHEFPCIVLAPQCPLSARWVEVDWSRPSHKMPQISVPMTQLFALLDSLVAVLPIDTNRVYITGLSMGGFGTWDALARRPGYFAAAMPVCGGGDESTANLMTQTPIRAFHGNLDHLVIPARTVNMVNAVNDAGGHAEYTIFPKLGHLCWEQVYSNVENIRWLFSQKRGK